MFEVSEDFKKAVEDLTITDKIEGIIELTTGESIPFCDENLKYGTLSIDNQCVNGEELEFGAVYSGQLSFQIQNEISRYALYGAKVTVSYFLLVNGEYEEVPMGIYWISEATRQGQYLCITALDSMANLDTDFDNVSVLGKPFELLSYIADKTGVPFETSQAEIEKLPNGKQQIQLDKNSGCGTWRDCVAIIAQEMGAFGTASRTGGFLVIPFAKEPCYSMPKIKHNSTEISDYECSYMGLKVTTEGTEYNSYNDAESGLIMSIDDNVLFYAGNKKSTQNKVDAVRTALCELVYTPANVTMCGIPFLGCGDMVTFTEKDDIQVNSIITSYVWKYRNSCVYKSAGKNPRLTSAKNKADRQTNSIRQTMEESKIVFLKGTNAKEISIENKETEILKFSITSIKDTSIVFLAQILVNVETETEEKTINGKVKEVIVAEDGTEEENERDCYFTTQKEKPCVVNFKYFMAKVEVDNFYPTEQLTEGQHILTLFYVLPDMEENSTIRFSVGMNCESGKITIPAENIKATVIGQGLNNSGIQQWDGTLDLFETLGRFDVQLEGTFFRRLKESISFKHHKPVEKVITEQLNRFSVNGAVTPIKTLVDSCKIEPVVKGYTVTTKENIPTYNEKYVKVSDNAFVLQNEWQFTSNPEYIDSGSMATLKIDTDGIAEIESVVIE